MRPLLLLAAGLGSCILSYGLVHVGLAPASAPVSTAGHARTPPAPDPAPAPAAARRCPEDPVLAELASEVREVDLEERLLRASIVRYEGLPHPWPSEGPTAEQRQAELAARYAPLLPDGVALGPIDCAEDPCLLSLALDDGSRVHDVLASLPDLTLSTIGFMEEGARAVARVGGEQDTRSDFRSRELLER
ncbi:MAG: hypothetical protein H6738_10215 [Alphaproteobacteria bacterium]|nr:hypothetical protein [Alphaproteobacteria bacterium]